MVSHADVLNICNAEDELHGISLQISEAHWAYSDYRDADMKGKGMLSHSGRTIFNLILSDSRLATWIVNRLKV